MSEDFARAGNPYNGRRNASPTVKPYCFSVGEAFRLPRSRSLANDSFPGKGRLFVFISKTNVAVSEAHELLFMTEGVEGKCKHFMK